MPRTADMSRISGPILSDKEEERLGRDRRKKFISHSNAHDTHPHTLENPFNQRDIG